MKGEYATSLAQQVSDFTKQWCAEQASLQELQVGKIAGEIGQSEISTSQGCLSYLHYEL